MVRFLGYESIGPGFEVHSEHLMNLFHGCPEFSNPSAALVNSRLFCLLPRIGILNHVMFHLPHLFHCLSGRPVN